MATSTQKGDRQETVASAGLLVLCTLTGTVGFLMTSVVKLEDNRLGIPPDKLDFGEVWAQDGLEWELPIQNRSNREMVLQALSPSCRCAVVEMNAMPLRIAAGETAIVRLKLNLFQDADLTSESAIRDVQVNFALRLKHELPARFTLRGRVRHAIRLQPGSLNFGDRLTEGIPFGPEIVIVTALVPLTDLQADVPRELGGVELRKEAGTTWRLSFTPEQRNHGSLAGLIKLTPISATGERLPNWPVRVAGAVMPEIRVLPEILDFGICTLGSPQTATLTVQSARNRPFKILRMVAGPCVRISGPYDPEQASQRLDVNFSPRTPSSDSVDVVLEVRNVEGETMRITLPVRAQVIAADTLRE